MPHDHVSSPAAHAISDASSVTLAWRHPWLAPWIERWYRQKDRWVADPGFRDFASRFAPTRYLARRRARELFDLVAGFVYSQWLSACVELRLFDRLARAPMTAEQLALESSLPLESARRLFDAASALKLVAPRGVDVNGHARFGLATLGAAMVGNEAIAALVRHHRVLYTDLADPLQLLHGGRGKGELSRYWSYASDAQPGGLDGSSTAPYSALMSASQPLIAAQVLDRYRIGRHKHLLDIGGGEGVFVAEALKRHAGLRATVFDLPSVAPNAQKRLAQLGFADRARAVGGDFHRDTLPLGADVVSLIRVIYDHDDAPATALLKAARRALPVGGTVLMAEPMAQTQGAAPMGAAYFGMYLLAMGSGRSRSAAQLTAMLHEAGFGHVRQHATALPLQTGLLSATAV